MRQSVFLLTYAVWQDDINETLTDEPCVKISRNDNNKKL